MQGTTSGFASLQWVLAPAMFGVATWVAAVLAGRVPRIASVVGVTHATRLHSIDALRGVLAVGVMTHHTAIMWFYVGEGAWKAPPSRLYQHLGQGSVALFFMISAFLFWGRVLDQGSRMDWGAFMLSRLFRLYPAYLVALALVVALTAALAVADGSFALSGEVGPLLSWLLFTAGGARPLNGYSQTNLVTAGVLWSLRYEWLFYIALPLVAWLAGRSQSGAAAMGSAAGLAVTAALFDWVPAASLFVTLSFGGGFLAAWWVRQPLLLAAARTSWACGLAMLALAMAVLVCSTAFTPIATVGLTLFFIPVAAGAAFWGLPRVPALLWLGEISYSVYLLHGLVLWVVLRLALPLVAGPPDPRTYLLGAALVAALTVLLASVVFLHVEHPSIRAGRVALSWWAKRWMRSAGQSAATPRIYSRTGAADS